ncbi:MAG: SMP-30/gluconolactonase/LRE family protein [Gammaproteobacteria bacterium]
MRLKIRTIMTFRALLCVSMGSLIGLLSCDSTVSQQESFSGTQNNSSDNHLAEPRVVPIPVSEMDARQKELLGATEGEPLPKRAQSNLFRTLMHHPELTAAYIPMGDRVFRAPEFPDQQRELIILRAAWLYQGRYEWSRHYDKALAAGWSPEDVERIKLGAAAPGWNELDRTLLKATDQLVRDAFIQDEVWATLREYYSVQDIMVMITLVTHYHWVAMMSKTLGVQPEKPVREFHPPTGGGGLKRETSVAFVEGPVARADGSILFTDIPNNRIMRWEKGGGAKVYLTPSGRANGLFYDSRGRLIMAETNGRLVRENPDGSIDVLADEFNGHPFNSLNDLAIDTAGRIYFTDPAYRNRQNAAQRDADGKIVDGVYRVDKDGSVSRVLTHEIDIPNGIIISPGDQYLYVAENNNKAGGARKIVRFELNKNGDVAIDSKKVIFDWGTERGPDGMAIDIQGNLYIAAGLNTPMPNRTAKTYKAGIYIISPQGKLLNFIAIPMDTVSNVTFGGADNKTLYITAGHSLWSYPVGIAGYHPF